MLTRKTKVACVGLVCLDVIQECFSYPEEDSDQRCMSIRWQRGGNAANISTVLSQIGIECEFLGSMSSHHELGFIKTDFEDRGICIDHCPTWKANVGKSFLDSFPVSTVLINSKNGSRTIVHSKGDLPELSLENFKELNLSDYTWIHFEGRNIDAISSMMGFIRAWRNDHSCSGALPTISLELEKPKPGLLSLAKFADVVFISKDFAVYHGWNGMESAVEAMSNHVREGAIVVCTWGELGSSAICLPSANGQSLESPKVIEKQLFHSPACPPSTVVDTLGAGDTFVAGFIRAFSAHISLPKALQFACKLAGAKVGMRGFTGISEAYFDILKGFPEIDR